VILVPAGRLCSPSAVMPGLCPNPVEPQPAVPPACRCAAACHRHRAEWTPSRLQAGAHPGRMTTVPSAKGGRGDPPIRPRSGTTVPHAPPPERMSDFFRSSSISGLAAIDQVSRFLGAPSRYRDRVRDGVFVIGAPSAAAGDRVRSGCDRSRLIEAVLGPLSSAVGTVLPCSMARAIVSRDWAMRRCAAIGS